jgi:hypothetical protein
LITPIESARSREKVEDDHTHKHANAHALIHTTLTQAHTTGKYQARQEKTLPPHSLKTSLNLNITQSLSCGKMENPKLMRKTIICFFK